MGSNLCNWSWPFLEVLGGLAFELCLVVHLRLRFETLVAAWNRTHERLERSVWATHPVWHVRRVAQVSVGLLRSGEV